MGKIYKLSLTLLLLVCVACGSDDDPSPNANNNLRDTEKPKIKFLSPEANSNHLVIDLITIRVRLTDNEALGNVSTWLVSADGQRQEVMEPFPFTDVLRNTEFNASFYPRDIASGTYKLVSETKDRNNNVAKDSVTITVQATDIDKTAFVKAFEKGNFYQYLDWGWFGVDFTNGIQFNEPQLSNGLYMMLSLDDNIKKDEWEKFVKDFRFEKQRWADWDANADNELDYDEFHKGISKLDLFKNWNLDNSQLINEVEFATGIFDRWDRNRDNLLSKDEYYNLFYTYLALRF